MKVHTYTNMWNEEKKLYSIYEWTLPTPVGFRQIGLFMFGSVIWMPIMFVLGVPINTPVGLVAWFAIPVLLAIFGNKQIFEGKSIFQYLQSIIGHVFEPKHVLDGQGVSIRSEQISDPNEKVKTVPHILEYEVWTKDKIERI